MVTTSTTADPKQKKRKFQVLRIYTHIQGIMPGSLFSKEKASHTSWESLMWSFVLFKVNYNHQSATLLCKMKYFMSDINVWKWRMNLPKICRNGENSVHENTSDIRHWGLI